MRLYIVSQRDVPTCGHADCDAKENPEHHVAITLSDEFLTILRQAADVVAWADDREGTQSQLLARLREAIEAGGKEG